MSTQANRGATADAGNLTINTRELLVRDGAQVVANTFGSSKGGNVVVTADSVKVIGTSATGLGSTLSAQANRGTGDAGNLTIYAREILIWDGANITTTTLGVGQGGNLKVHATSSVEVKGVNPIRSGFVSGLYVQQNTKGATGNAGNLTINTPVLRVLDGANISAATFGVGRGGSLKIDAGFVQVIGASSNESSRSSIATQASTTATGTAGDLTIKTDQLLVQDRAEIAARSLGAGTAGNLTIDANSINLDKNATLTADTPSNRTDVNQATININSRDLILRRNSSITTNAINPFVIGGDISINTDLLGAFENSKITANSANFRGGNINIRTQGLFRSFDNAITASGATSELSGNVNVITVLDPSRGLVEIPINLVDPSGLILARCSLRNSPTQNSFTVTGRGGLPISPEDLLQDVNIIVNWINSSNLFSSTIEQSIQAQKDKTANPIVEASSWKVDNGGQVYLVASKQDVQSQYLPSESNLCPN